MTATTAMTTEALARRQRGQDQNQTLCRAAAATAAAAVVIALYQSPKYMWHSYQDQKRIRENPGANSTVEGHRLFFSHPNHPNALPAHDGRTVHQSLFVVEM
jgi:hypothetical protein